MAPIPCGPVREGRSLFAGEQGVFFCCCRPFGCLASKSQFALQVRKPRTPTGAHSSWASHPNPSPIPLEARAAPSLAPTQASLAKSSPPLEHHCNNNNIRPWNTRRIQSVIHSSSALPAKPTTNSVSRITLLDHRHKCCFRPLSARFLARPWTWTRFRAGSDLPTYILATLRLDTQTIGIRTDKDRL